MKAFGNNSRSCGENLYCASTNTGCRSHERGSGKSRNSLVGHVIHVDDASHRERCQDDTIVHRPAPMNPSHVLFGEKTMKACRMNCRPNIIPQTYAMMSFVTTSMIGRANQNSPLKTLCMMYLS